jgi:hypothetical protein
LSYNVLLDILESDIFGYRDGGVYTYTEEAYTQKEEKPMPKRIQPLSDAALKSAEKVLIREEPP